MEVATLPVIDLTLANGAERAALVKQVVEALETTGFFYLTGVDGYDENNLYKYAEWFFNKSLKEKMTVATSTYNRSNTNHYRGYFPVKPDTVTHKEGYEIGLDTKNGDLRRGLFFYESTPWPRFPGEEAQCEDFREFLQGQYGVMHRACFLLLSLVAEGLGVTPDWFEQLFLPDPLSTLRLICYPPRTSRPPPGSVVGDVVLVCDEHHDTGFFTLLTPFHFRGLQIQLTPDAPWMDVPIKNKCLVVNIGDTFAAMSGGLFKATKHRVVDIGEPRLSVPFFLEPRFDADITRRLTDNIDESNISFRTYSDLLIHKMKGFIEYRQLCEDFGL